MGSRKRVVKGISTVGGAKLLKGLEISRLTGESSYLTMTSAHVRGRPK